MAVGTAGIAGNLFGAEEGAREKKRHAPVGNQAAATNVPRELAMRPLPAYRIDPPDILGIEISTFKDTPTRGGGTVSGDGLAPVTGSGGMTKTGGGTLILRGSNNYIGTTMVTSGNAKPTGKAAKQTTKPLGSLPIKKSNPKVAGPPITGQYLIAPDGTVNLHPYGMVQVMGKTVEEATAAVQRQVAKYLTSAEVSIHVIAYNSKVYYIITEGAGLGDNVRRVPITGNDTVLDALAAINGLSQVSSKKMWIARPSPTNAVNGTILPVDYAGITQRGATATNYQIMPGDRLFIAEDRTTAVNNWVAKKTTSIERVLGLISLGAATVESIEKLWPESPDYPSKNKAPPAR
jgi:polysaccharide export outer membrane protein